MTATRARKRSAAKKTRRGLDDPPSRRTRSQTHRDRLCALLLKLDPAAITRAIKVIEAYDEERSSSQSLAQASRLAVKPCGGRRAAQVKPAARKPAASRADSSINAPAAFNSGKTFGSTITSRVSTNFGTPRPVRWSPSTNTPTAVNLANPFGSSAANHAPTTSMTSNRAGYLSSIPTWGGKFSSADDIKRFSEQVLIVKGDIGSITHLHNHKIDGIAFPTKPSLRNSGSGAAAAVFARAGDGLASYVQGLTMLSTAGTARVTPGFGAGVDKLIHAVGPYTATPFRLAVLEYTYRNVMEAAQRENLQCLALAALSTGSNGGLCENEARAALRAILHFLSKDKWPGVVGIVCRDQNGFDALTHEKQAMLECVSTM